MKELLESWIYNYTSVFNDELDEKPARVQPFKLSTKANSNWYTSAANKAPPRWQVLSKQNKVRRFVEKALIAKLIQPSNATAWSQVHLTPKPNGK